MLEKSFPLRDSNSFNVCDYIQGRATFGGTVRFGLRCVVALAILYRAILVSQGGSETAALSSKLADAMPVVQARVRDEVATRIGGYCRTQPAACLADAARLASFTADGPAGARRSRHGAIAASTR